ncbi:hypothetical protein [Actinomadura fulvescens]
MRQDRVWVTAPGDHDVLVCGRTLRDIHAGVHAALVLLHAPAPPPLVQVRPQSPGLDELAKQQHRYQQALRVQAQKLRDDGVSWSDVAQACGVRITDAQAAVRGAVPGPSFKKVSENDDLVSGR